MQFLHALAASTVQSRQVFASTLPEQLFKLKNEDAIKKSENLPYLLSAIHQHYAWPDLISWDSAFNMHEVACMVMLS